MKPIQATFQDLQPGDRFEIPSLPFTNPAGFPPLFTRMEGRRIRDENGNGWHWPNSADDRAVVIVARREA